MRGRLYTHAPQVTNDSSRRDVSVLSSMYVCTCIYVYLCVSACRQFILQASVSRHVHVHLHAQGNCIRVCNWLGMFDVNTHHCLHTVRSLYTCTCTHTYRIIIRKNTCKYRAIHTKTPLHTPPTCKPDVQLRAGSAPHLYVVPSHVYVLLSNVRLFFFLQTRCMRVI